MYDALSRSRYRIGFKDFYVSNLILIETFQKLQKTIGYAETVSYYHTLLNGCKIVEINHAIVETAIHKKLGQMRNHNTGKPPFGLVDATSLVVMEQKKLLHILSFDGHFENVPLLRKINNPDTIPSNLLD
ncbi:hypothetical protein ES707_12051 [subsurface metagenome]